MSGARLQDTINVMVPVGALGTGVRASNLDAGLVRGAHVIACDAGSTDSGAAYLATAQAKYSRDAVKTDLRLLMLAQAKAGIPLLVGTCGTAGTDATVDWTRDIVLEIAREEGLNPKITLLYSEQLPADMADRAAAGNVTPLAPITTAEPETFLGCDRIVALMGPEPYIAALEGGADIVLGGRTTDTAVLAAMPLMRGMHAGAAWHAAKIAECGGLCTRKTRLGGVMMRVGADAFEIEPLDPDNVCDPYSVSSHMLYENSDPFELIEPGGVLDVREAHYEAVDARTVQVHGSRFDPRPYTMKLEGAAGGPFQTIMMVGIQDPKVLGELDRFLRQMEGLMEERVRNVLGDRIGAYDISLRAYGWNAVSGTVIGPREPAPREIGLLFVATAGTQAEATLITKTCNPLFFHMPLDLEMELPSYGFPFSPAEIERGRVYEFKLNHVVHVASPTELVRTIFLEMPEVTYA